MAKRTPSEPQCPCGSGHVYAQCCDPLHRGGVAATAEALMRSRYSAYVLGLEDYVLSTWHPDTRPMSLNLAEDPGQWIGLKILTTEAGQADDSEGWVEFVARYKHNGRAQRMQERSYFVLQESRWFYVAAE